MENKIIKFINLKIQEIVKLSIEKQLSNQEIKRITLEILEKNLIVKEKLKELSNKLNTNDLKEILHSIIKILKEIGILIQDDFCIYTNLYIDYIIPFLKDKKGNRMNELPKCYYDPICNTLDELRKDKIIDGYRIITTNNKFSVYESFEIYWSREGK